MPKNYYIILGVPSGSSLDDIKNAYRKLVKEYHPDHYGDKCSPFLNIQEAYSVLSDPVRRRNYDATLKDFRKKSEQKRRVEPMHTSSQGEVEPLIPEEGPADLGDASLSRSFHHYQPSFGSLFDKIFSNFNEQRSKSGQIENLNVVVTLTAGQAFKGGHVRIFVPSQLQCPRCKGQGGVGFYECWHCGGEGIKTGEYPVMVSYPPGISDNHTVRISLERYGIYNLYLTVTFRISEMG